MSDRILRTLRSMEWERVKGGLQAILQTYWDEASEVDYKNTVKRISDFIVDMSQCSDLG